MPLSKTALASIALALVAVPAAVPAIAETVSVGPRPYYLASQLPEGPLRDKLMACDAPAAQTTFSIGHRGAPLMFPEHTVQSNMAAARMGAGILECDVAFTKDLELVCRHAQNDLHTTTDILATDLGEKCTTPFAPAANGQDAQAECRTSDITLAEFKTLNGKMDAADKSATTLADYMAATPNWRTDLYATRGDLMTHAESIRLFRDLGAKFTPELKSPAVEMPFNGFTQADYAQKLIDEYKAAGIPASDVYPQSFNLEDVLYWIEAEPEFGAQAVYLVEPDSTFNEQTPETWSEDFNQLAAQGVRYLAPSINMLITDQDGEIHASEYAKEAKAAGLNLISWSLERSGPLANGGGWYYAPVNDIIDNDSDYLVVVDVLAQEVGIEGLFSDWPGTVTYYANCMGL